jgi:hypothetical protein
VPPQRIAAPALLLTRQRGSPESLETLTWLILPVRDSR